MKTLLPLVLLIACRPKFATVADACKDGFSGSGNASPATTEAVNRMNCYRRMAQLPEFGVDQHVETAVNAHVAWMQQNHSINTVETAGTPGYTGADALSRLSIAGGGVLDVTTNGYWEFYGDEPLTEKPAAIIDSWMSDLYLRQMFLQVDVDRMGWAQDKGYSYGNILYGWPASSHSWKPIVYPVDGQQDVPTTFVSYHGVQADDGVPDNVPLGFPITVTISATAQGGFDTENPYNVSLVSSSVTGPGGLVPTYVVVPPGDPASGETLQATVILVPKQPLTPNADYEYQVETNSNDGQRSVDVKFHTASNANAVDTSIYQYDTGQ